ncbi:28S ribosomal protein S14, mitochondrial [Galendromus occidentalis]|uniref:28S ribosomal protein S14, mitochondrial n=1 Tax=Galendromus occidentalis TaxID=34638 RepID=A0AAJ6QPS9_9ACAR|nr:28S ribosomal protein S14, mitochondrial [Galendromus occidentalis]
MQALARFTSSIVARNPIAEIQCRGYMTDWRMLRDYKRRQCVAKHYFERNQLNTLRKNTILPRVLQEAAHEELKKLPRDSATVRIHQRCCVTSYPRNVSIRYRLARHAWRHLADYNKLSGIQKALW